MRKTTPLTIEEHMRLGQELHIIREFLGEMFIEVANNRYGKSSKVTGKLRRAERALDALRCELDSQIVRDYPNIPDDFTKIHYGSTPDTAYQSSELMRWVAEQSEEDGEPFAALAPDPVRQLRKLGIYFI